MKILNAELDAWHAQAREDVIDPDRLIVDPHHHLYQREDRVYLLDDLHRDTGSGHRVAQTVFVQCRTHYLQDGPEHLRPVGETGFVARVAAESRRRGDGNAVIAGIVAYANLKLGRAVEEVLAAHEEAGQGLFRGIRQVAAHDPHEELGWMPAQVAPGLYGDPAFIEGLRTLGGKGYTFDAWHYHPQMQEFIAAARSVPETVFVLDHFGTILGVGPYAHCQPDIFANWRKDLAELARLPNVNLKLGGATMPVNGHGWEERVTPVSSDEYALELREMFLHAIDCFGPDRCMFESNFPVDKVSVSYRTVWNAYKKIAAPFSEAEKAALFSGTATRIYRLGES